MNILLLYPKYPETFWSFKHALKFISKKAANIPLGILTVAALLPEEWNKKVIDLNVCDLKDKDILWSDFVFISAMSVQLESVTQIINRCRMLNAKIVAGGPLFTEEFEEFSEIDHLVLNEAEITLPLFLEDIKNGSTQKIYQSNQYADMTISPVPDYSLIERSKYVSATIQYSRGCPFDCEFCDITALLGRKVRTKTSAQIISELEQLLHLGWKGSVFFVDDNFIGNKQKLKCDILPAIINWMKLNNYPFVFTTETSINLADDQELMEMMVLAGFSRVFVGIETPDENCLSECNKLQNKNRDLAKCVNEIQKYGLEVMAGFIVGFDNDPLNIFQRQIDFIQKSRIVIAMTGLLNAPKQSKLYKRLQSEGRIIDNWTGCNTDYSMNFIPAMDRDILLNGYHKIVNEIYSCKLYYARVLSFLQQFNPPYKNQHVNLAGIIAFLKTIFFLGILKEDRKYYWHLLLWSLIRKPKTFPLVIMYSIYGYHFRRVFRNYKITKKVI